MWTDPNSCSGGMPFGIMNRRQMLHKMCAGFGMLGLASVLGPGSLLGASAAHLPHFTPKAKRIVFLFMNGGPSHIDTFDPKPALAKYAGQQPDGELYKKSKGT